MRTKKYKDYRTRMKSVLSPEIKDIDADVQKEQLDDLVEDAKFEFTSAKFQMEKELKIMERELDKQCCKKHINAPALIDLYTAIDRCKVGIRNANALADELGLGLI